MRQRLSDVVGGGDRRQSLEAVRDKLAGELEEAFGKDSATISRELREVLRELAALTGSTERSAVDELAARRAARRANASGQ